MEHLRRPNHGRSTEVTARGRASCRTPDGRRGSRGPGHGCHARAVGTPLLAGFSNTHLTLGTHHADCDRPLRRRRRRTAEGVRDARRAVVEACRGLAGDVVETARLLTSELVTNALEHGAGTIHVEVTRRPANLMRVSVDDDGSQRPHHVAAGPESERGRGLMLVESRFLVGVSRRVTLASECGSSSGRPDLRSATGCDRSGAARDANHRTEPVNPSAHPAGASCPPTSTPSVAAWHARPQPPGSRPSFWPQAFWSVVAANRRCAPTSTLSKASVDNLKNVEVSQGGLSKLQGDLSQVKSDLSKVKSDAKSQYSDEIDAVDQAATSLSSDLSAATDSPSAATIAPPTAPTSSRWGTH